MLRTLTSTVTALAAEFRLEDDPAHGLQGILNQEFARDTEMAQAVDKWRISLRQEAARWLAKRFPGSFHRLAPGRLPTIEFLLTSQHLPPGAGAGFVSRTYPVWPDLEGLDGRWQYATIPSLRLRKRSFLLPGSEHDLVLTGLEEEFMADPEGGGGYSSVRQASISIGIPLIQLLFRWSLTALIREQEEQLVRIQDVADQASRKRSPRALREAQRQLVQLGIDSRIVVNDIVRNAQDASWKWRVPDFFYLPPPDISKLNIPDTSKPVSGKNRAGSVPTPTASENTAAPANGTRARARRAAVWIRSRPCRRARTSAGPGGHRQDSGQPAASLAESLRQGQITDGQRVSQLGTDLREVLSTSAELASASENIRLQRRVVWITVVAAIIAAVSAFLAARSSSGSTPTPSRHATNSSVHAPVYANDPADVRVYRDQLAAFRESAVYGDDTLKIARRLAHPRT